MVVGLAVVLAVSKPALAQSPIQVTENASIASRPLEIDRGAAALWQSLLKLHTRASVIMIDAHPDDEDGGLLAYASRGQGARATLLTLTRGEGGQNLMSPDLFDALGLVRSEELLQSSRHYGAQQYFTSVIDFGFSKSKEEALQKWGHESTLAQAVRIIRMVRPLVVTSVFVGGPSDGHGQHQTSGQIAQEAYRDAGDPNQFPDQIRAGLMPWTPLKDYAKVPPAARVDNVAAGFGDEGAVGFGKIFDYADSKTYPLRFFNYTTGKWMDGMLSADLTIPEGRYDGLLGGSYVQVSREGLGYQKSQDGGPTIPAPGAVNSTYHLFNSRVPVPPDDNSMFAGIDVSLAGIADLAAGQDNAFLKTGLAEMNRDIEQAMHGFNPEHLDAIAPPLAAAAKLNLALIEKVQASSLSATAKYNVLHELREKQAQFNAALAESLGLTVQVAVTPAVPARPGGYGPPSTPRVVIPGQTLYVSVRGANSGSLPVTFQRAWVATPPGEKWIAASAAAPAKPGPLEADQAQSERFQIEVPQNAQSTQPYFRRDSLLQNVYTISNPNDLGLPFAPYPVSGWVEFQYDGVPVKLGQVAQTADRQPGWGTVEQPLIVAPAISVWLPTRASVVPLEAKSFDLSVTLHSNAVGAAKGTLKLELPEGWSSEPATADFAIAHSGEEESVTFQVQPHGVQPKAYALRAVASFDGRAYTSGYLQTGYPGLRPYNLFRPADFKTTGVDLKIAPGLKVGFVPGTGEELPQSLASVGVPTTVLGPGYIASGDLSKFNAIILGVRSYSVRPDLGTYNARLLAFVHQGGTLIVEYQQGPYHGFTPYPFTVGTGSTSTLADEDSAVQFLLPGDPSLTWPNKIGAQDFTGWVEERGHGFPASWGPQWRALFEMHDPGVAPQKGGLLIARYGKGEYVYDALALYRQLPEGVPGSYRILANLLSLSSNPALASSVAAAH